MISKDELEGGIFPSFPPLFVLIPLWVSSEGEGVIPGTLLHPLPLLSLAQSAFGH